MPLNFSLPTFRPCRAYRQGPTHGPPERSPRPGRTCRRPACLAGSSTARAGLAALACVALVCFAAPAHAQTTIWTATLTVGSADSTHSNGYNNGGRFSRPIADFGTLTDGDFEAAGTTYTIETLRWGTGGGSGDEDGSLFFEVHTGVPAPAVYNTWTLHIGTDQFAFSDASLGVDEANQFKWANAYDPDDSAKPTPPALNATVAVKITASSPTNNAPNFSDTTLTRSIAENTVPDTNIGTPIPEASDADGDPLTYSLEGTHEASFNFDTSARRISTKTGVAYDYEDTSSYSVTVRVHDSKGGTDTVDVTISLTDENEPPAAPGNSAPVFSDATLTREVDENTVANVNIGDVIPAATDADNDDLAYSMEGPDAASFNFDVSARQISTKDGVTYDFEATKNSYSVAIRVSDGTDSDTVEVTIDVTDVLERPDAPARPTVVATMGSNTSLDVSWTVPNNDGRPDITGYDLQWRPATTNTWTDGPQGVTGTSAKITGLRADRRYRVRVRARNNERSGPFSGASPFVSTNSPSLHVPATREVPADWPLKPAALGVGDKFRLLFVTGERYRLFTQNLDFSTRLSAPKLRAVTPISSAMPALSHRLPVPITAARSSTQAPPPATRVFPCTGSAGRRLQTTTRTCTTGAGIPTSRDSPMEPQRRDRETVDAWPMGVKCRAEAMTTTMSARIESWRVSRGVQGLKSKTHILVS